MYMYFFRAPSYMYLENFQHGSSALKFYIYRNYGEYILVQEPKSHSWFFGIKVLYLSKSSSVFNELIRMHFFRAPSYFENL